MEQKEEKNSTRIWACPPLTSAWSATWGNRCVLDSPPPRLPMGTGGPSPSSLWPQSAGWIPPPQMGCWPGIGSITNIVSVMKQIPRVFIKPWWNSVRGFKAYLYQWQTHNPAVKATFTNSSHTDEGMKGLSEVYLEDLGLLFEVLILIGLGIRKVVNLDAVFINLIQNLRRPNMGYHHILSSAMSFTYC